MTNEHYTKSPEETLRALEVSATGLSDTEARERFAQYGPNAIRVKGEPLWRKIIEPFLDIMMGVLLVAAIISVLQHEIIDAGIIVFIMFCDVIIYYIQRFSTERILRALQKKSVDKVEVLRENQPRHIDSDQIVPGDIVILDEGERVPADGRVIVASSLRVDESQLTGESLPIEKQTEALPGTKQIYERTNMVYQGSFVVGGHANILITETGNDTEYGKLAALSVPTNEESPVQRKIDRLVSMTVRVIAAVGVVAFFLSIYRGASMGESLRYVLALSVSAVPESLPVAISVVLVLGMRRMAAKKALVRTMRAIETVGTLTTIATDKTGTLTHNKLSLQHTWSPVHTDAAFKKVIADAAILSKTKVHDPLDTALIDYAKPGSKRVVLQMLPFDQTVAMSGNVHDSKDGAVLWLKGAPEHIIAKSKLSAAERHEAESQLHSLAANGFRVIACAHTPVTRDFDDLGNLEKRKDLTFDGLIGIADTLRDEAAPAIKRAVRAGVSVRMITGDHFDTAYHIGRELGMVEHRDQVFDCRELHRMSDAELEKVIDGVRVFSRVIPEHKHRILTILKKHHITAMTGDGVNDVPALTGAHVGLAMGSGTSIAKEAGDIILLDDNFRTIVHAIHEGRTIYANIKRMVAYLLSTNAGEVLIALLALVTGTPIPLLAAQILWVNLVTDTAMVIPLGLEPGEKHNMNRPPQKPSAPLFSRFMLMRIVLVAVSMMVVVFWLYKDTLAHQPLGYARTVAFHALVVMQWASAFNFRSDYESLASRLRRLSGTFYAGLAFAIAMQLLALFGPLSDFLKITPLSGADLLRTTLIAFFAPIMIVEIHKWVGRRFFGKGHLAKRLAKA